MSTSNRITPMDVEDYLEDDTASNVSEINNVDEESNAMDQKAEANPLEAWLPITESRNGNMWSCICHLVSSGISFQVLMLPVAFATLGWAWGITFLSLGFAWQLYTRWLLIQLHESESGVRYSRFMQLAIVAFGPKLAKWVCLFPVLYLSGGTCTILVITGGSTLKMLYEVICSGSSVCPKSITTTLWYLVFVCCALLLLQHPNLNSLSLLSFLGTITALLFCTLLWTVSLAKGGVQDVTHEPTFEELTTNLTRFLSTASAMELIALAFKGHNLILEIQGTLPSSLKHPPHKTMWKAVRISYSLIGLCMFPLAIVGFSAYGDKISKKGLLHAFEEFHRDRGSKIALSVILIFLIVAQLCSYQVYAMPALDNFALHYAMSKKKPCPFWFRRVSRVFFASVNFFLAVTFPFLPRLAPVIGVVGLELAFVYPCFIWICIKKPRATEPMFWVNWVLGCLGILISVIFVVAAIWNLSREGLTANYFHPE